VNNDAKQNPGMVSEEEVKLWDFYLSIGVMGAEELRKELGLDELNFQRLAPNLNQEPKKYFLYRVLDEIQKSALKIGDWKEYLYMAKSSSSGQRELNQAMTIGLPAIVCKVGLRRC
jgi:hypothetical protein